MQLPSPGTYLPYCQCKGAGVPWLSPPRGAGLLSVPSARGRKHRPAVSPCLWDLLPTPLPLGPCCPQDGLCQGQLCWVLQPVQAPAVLGAPAHLQSLICGQQAVIPPHLMVFSALCSSCVGARIICCG